MLLNLGLGFVATLAVAVFIDPFTGILAVLAFLLLAGPETRAAMVAGALLGLAAGLGYHLELGSLSGAAAPRLGP
jgi:hypothetical protein